MADAESLLVPPLRDGDVLDAYERLTRRLLEQDVRPVVVVDIDRLPSSAFPHMAEQLSISDEPAWELAETDAVKRNLLRYAFELHRYKGTIYAVRMVFRLLGLGEVDVLEGRGGRRRDGQTRRDGYGMRGDASVQWAVYRIVCYRLLTSAQADMARRMLASMVPARCALYDIDFTKAAVIRNGFARRDGTYSRGSA